MRPRIFILLTFLFFMTACSSSSESEPVTPEKSDDGEAITGENNEPAAVAPTETAVHTPTPDHAKLPVLGAAPEWQNETWINSEVPLPLADLHGKVVLLEFWTFG